jgi:hypothetical protein
VATWLLEETVVNALTSSILTPEYLRQSLEDAQRAANERRPGLDGEIGALEREVADKEASVRGLLQLIQKQGLSPLLEDEYQRANLAWSTVFTRLANAKKEADQLEAPQLSEAEIQAYIADMRGILQTGTIADRQELLRRFIHSVVLYPSHVEVAYNFGPTTLAPLGNFGVPRSPIEGAPREERSKGLSKEHAHTERATRRQIELKRHSKRNQGTRWAYAFDSCIDCGTSKRPHRAHGRCKRCDDRWRTQNRHASG